MKNNKKWKDVPGYEGFYKVSNFGEVMSFERSGTKGIVLKPHVSNGYSRVILSKNGIQYNVGVHRLVAQAFLPNPDNKRTVNHKDGNKQNNIISNLEWATHKEQLEHSFRKGLRKTQCNIQRKGVIIFPNDDYKCFENLKALSEFLGYKKSYCQNKCRKYGKTFYSEDKMICVSDPGENYIIKNYQRPSITDVSLPVYCKLNGLNYNTMKSRRNYKGKEAFLQSMKEGD